MREYEETLVKLYVRVCVFVCERSIRPVPLDSNVRLHDPSYRPLRTVHACVYACCRDIKEFEYMREQLRRIFELKNPLGLPWICAFIFAFFVVVIIRYFYVTHCLKYFSIVIRARVQNLSNTYHYSWQILLLRDESRGIYRWESEQNALCRLINRRRNFPIFRPPK